jgi:hypothetical protein
MLNSDWEEYFSHFINCAELGRWTNQDKMLGLSANLRGPERIFYLSLSLHHLDLVIALHLVSFGFHGLEIQP